MNPVVKSVATATAAVVMAASPAVQMVQTAWGDTVPLNQTRFKYGRYWDKSVDDLTIELAAFRSRFVEEPGGGLGAAAHFWEVVNILWGPDNEQKQFIRNPWSEKMLEEALAHKFLSVAGAASSGKSLFYAIYAIVNWLADPANTTVLITSTSLKESKGRIWADVEEWWNAAQKKCNGALPGKLVSSLGLLKLEDTTGEVKTSDRSGLHLIAGEKKKEKDTIGKLIGYKNKRLLFIGDEMPELSAALIEAATGNLDSSEKEWFQFIGIGNPNSVYDPHGMFSKPKAGWKSVNPSVFEWETDLGYCIRFDAYQSPNILAGRVIYKWLPTLEKVDSKKEELGAESLAFWRMWRGFWCATGGTESVVSEADIIGYDCEAKVRKWKNDQFKRVAFLDAGFTTGGDRSIAYFAKFGVNEATDLETLEFEDYEVLFADVMIKDKAHSFQVATQFKEKCETRGIPPELAGVDDTGAAAFGDIVHTVWSRQVRRVNFGGAASKLQVSAHDKRLACDRYKNRVTEIWCCLREYMRGNQIRGICPDLAVELTARKMISKKSGEDLKARVESKEQMRDRTGKSPDIADAALGILDMLRSKYRFRAAAKALIGAITTKKWKGFVKKIGDRLITPSLDRSV